MHIRPLMKLPSNDFAPRPATAATEWRLRKRLKRCRRSKQASVYIFVSREHKASNCRLLRKASFRTAWPISFIRECSERAGVSKRAASLELDRPHKNANPTSGPLPHRKLIEVEGRKAHPKPSASHLSMLRSVSLQGLFCSEKLTDCQSIHHSARCTKMREQRARLNLDKIRPRQAQGGHEERGALEHTARAEADRTGNSAAPPPNLNQSSSRSRSGFLLSMSDSVPCSALHSCRILVGFKRDIDLSVALTRAEARRQKTAAVFEVDLSCISAAAVLTDGIPSTALFQSAVLHCTPE